ncbi:acyltransferase family protein [Massilia niastensis]|uniref:acyltransferase family protein n=1 Tax=Massilia niastensis TaxID=544911 RepID=UPI00036049A6|nr:heparan-alpha-glucosaminide N-acetyltransferase domain-containing protein [Massilia niastensis]
MTDAPVRLTSLDAFRGFTIAAMVLVNNPGDWGKLYPQLAHAKWHGWTFTDTIFPFFLFIGGVAMALSLGRLAAGGADRPRLLLKLAKRAALIFLIGFLLNLIPRFDFDAVRIPGVLQRIALCTMLAAPLVVYLGWRGQLAAIALLLTLYSVLMLAVPVPGIGAGVLEPGKDVGAWIDRALLDGHLWVQAKTWDPEGLLSTLPALCSQLFGVLAGRLLLARIPRAEQTIWLLLGGLACLALGSTLDALLMPINKSLWTPSYCLLMTGWAALAFAAFLWLLDANPHAALRERVAAWSKPFVIYGMNALFIFAFSGFVAKMLGFIKLAQPDGSQLSLGRAIYAPIAALPLGPVNTSLLYAIAFNACMFGIAWIMWRRRWFVKV